MSSLRDIRLAQSAASFQKVGIACRLRAGMRAIVSICAVSVAAAGVEKSRRRRARVDRAYEHP